MNNWIVVCALHPVRVCKNHSGACSGRWEGGGGALPLLMDWKEQYIYNVFGTGRIPIAASRKWFGHFHLNWARNSLPVCSLYYRQFLSAVENTLICLYLCTVFIYNSYRHNSKSMIIMIMVCLWFRNLNQQLRFWNYFYRLLRIISHDTHIRYNIRK